MCETLCGFVFLGIPWYEPILQILWLTCATIPPKIAPGQDGAPLAPNRPHWMSRGKGLFLASTWIGRISSPKVQWCYHEKTAKSTPGRTKITVQQIAWIFFKLWIFWNCYLMGTGYNESIAIGSPAYHLLPRHDAMQKWSLTWRSGTFYPNPPTHRQKAWKKTRR